MEDYQSLKEMCVQSLNKFVDEVSDKAKKEGLTEEELKRLLEE